MGKRSRIFIAEAFLDLGGVTWRIASGPGWASVGGRDVHASGRLRANLDTELTDEVIAAVTQPLHNVVGEMTAMAQWIEAVDGLHYG